MMPGNIHLSKDTFYYSVYLTKSLLRNGCDKTILILFMDF